MAVSCKSRARRCCRRWIRFRGRPEPGREQREIEEGRNQPTALGDCTAAVGRRKGSGEATSLLQESRNHSLKGRCEGARHRLSHFIHQHHQSNSYLAGKGGKGLRVAPGCRQCTPSPASCVANASFHPCAAGTVPRESLSTLNPTPACRASSSAALLKDDCTMAAPVPSTSLLGSPFCFVAALCSHQGHHHPSLHVPSITPAPPLPPAPCTTPSIRKQRACSLA